MSPRFRLFALSSLLLASHALAAEPPARDRAKALVAELDKQGATQGAARDAVAEAKRALVRADRARLAGDQKHGTELESLALEWAEAGRDLMRTAAAERRAAELETKLTEAEVKLRTTRTLIEQAAARRARADAELAELERNAQTPAPAASSVAPTSGKPPKAPASATPAAKPAPSAAPAAKPASSAAPPAKPAPSATQPKPPPSAAPPSSMPPKPKEPK